MKPSRISSTCSGVEKGWRRGGEGSESFGVLFDFECGLNSAKEKDRDIGVCCRGEFENLREHVFVFGNTRLGNVYAEVFAFRAWIPSAISPELSLVTE